MFYIKAKNIILSTVKWISTVGVILVVMFTLLVVGVKLLGWDVYVVLSGSMEPEIPTGSIIYTKEPDIENLEVGDIITFKLTGGKVATHRIDSIEGSGEDMVYITKGDANDNVDANPVAPGNVIGEFVAVVPFAGFIINYVQSPVGIFVSIAVIAALLILMLIPDIFADDADKKKKRKKGKNIDCNPEVTDISETETAKAEAVTETDAEPEEIAEATESAELEETAETPQGDETDGGAEEE